MLGLLQSNLSQNNYEYKELHRASKDRNITLIDSWNMDKSENFDFTINRNYWEKSIELQSGRQFNKLTDGYFWHDKLRQQHLVVPCKKPRTIFGSYTYVECCNLLGCPFVAKQSVSFGGNGVFLIKSQEDFDKALHCNIFQECIWTSFGKDIRVWCLGDKILGAIKRENNSDFRANMHQGGTCGVYDVDVDIKEIVKEIYKQTQLDFMGIDLLFGKNEYYFCELNVNPGFNGFDKAHGINVADNMIDYILSVL